MASNQTLSQAEHPSHRGPKYPVSPGQMAYGRGHVYPRASSPYAYGISLGAGPRGSFRSGRLLYEHNAEVFWQLKPCLGDGLVAKGERGEVATRALMLCAHDRAALEEGPINGLLYCRPIRLLFFLKALLTDAAFQTLMEATTASQESDAVPVEKFKVAFAHAWIKSIMTEADTGILQAQTKIDSAPLVDVNPTHTQSSGSEDVDRPTLTLLIEYGAPAMSVPAIDVAYAPEPTITWYFVVSIRLVADEEKEDVSSLLDLTATKEAFPRADREDSVQLMHQLKANSTMEGCSVWAPVQNGYRDLIASIDLSTYRRIPWENNVPFFLVSFHDPETKEPLVVDPRGISKITTERAEALGRQCYAGVEYEYFNFKGIVNHPHCASQISHAPPETPATLAEKKFTDLQPLTPGNHGYSLLRTQLNNDFFQDLFDESAKFRIAVESHHTETGPGVLETALAYMSAQQMADSAILFKYLAKSIGIKHGVLPSFMAKPWGNLPGCSGHVHVSLRDEGGKNVFALSEAEREQGRKDAQYTDTRFISQEAEWFLAGVLDGIADVMPTLVPTINGYKRLVGGAAFWAPNAITYGYDSRAASIRIIAPPAVPPSATRLEIRVPGADMNPHFALSAIFLLGIRGIEKKLKLPGPPIGEADPKQVKYLPTSLEAATARMMRSGSVAREPGVFGDVFVDHFGGTREHEVQLWNQAVTNWELERYIELA
ncbi:hypothetical protein DXG03_008817 [Asterophora parasitica]|uniref:GS catalytic domain-containing protein n=1 Tax=Asterophora parasitica TaxID=117018 RepID=A0A9P7G524_9AGAR|nr:hypothetical protein DXG03_008817 [Asterophora parasitica]